jgi:hypothetical protein
MEKNKPIGKKSSDKGISGRVLVGTIIVMVGIGLLLQNLFPGFFNFNYVWPLIIIAIGLYLIMRERK